MATVLKLHPRPRSDSPLQLGASAEIIIFPGVRYERMAEAEPMKAKRKRRSRKRDTLVISA
jgi:hypothetical protein